MYIGCSEFYKVRARLLSDSCQVAARCFTLRQGLRVDNLPCPGWGVSVLVLCCEGPSSRAQVPSQVERVWS